MSSLSVRVCAGSRKASRPEPLQTLYMPSELYFHSRHMKRDPFNQDLHLRLDILCRTDPHYQIAIDIQRRDSLLRSAEHGIFTLDWIRWRCRAQLFVCLGYCGSSCAYIKCIFSIFVVLKGRSEPSLSVLRVSVCGSSKAIVARCKVEIAIECPPIRLLSAREPITHTVA